MPRSVRLFFILVDSTANVVAFDTWETAFDLGPPDPPSRLAVDRSVAASPYPLIPLTWTFSLMADVQGYSIFCDPSPDGSGAPASGECPTD